METLQEEVRSAQVNPDGTWTLMAILGMHGPVTALNPSPSPSLKHSLA